MILRRVYSVVMVLSLSSDSTAGLRCLLRREALVKGEECYTSLQFRLNLGGPAWPRLASAADSASRSRRADSSPILRHPSPSRRR